MITEIPTASDFKAAGLNQLNLAWQIAMKVIQDYEEVEYTKDISGLADDPNLTSGQINADDQSLYVTNECAPSDEYWAKSQPELANAFGLIQQAMEMALKGRIASISPFLLISRDPKDWPRGVDTGAVPFSEFRTLDAADLVKVHNTFATVPLDEKFREFWEKVRRDRNKIMHSVSTMALDAATLVRTMLTAAQTLFGEVYWPKRLLDLESTGKYAAYGFDDYSYNVVLHQIDIAIRHLTPKENKTFFGFDTKRHCYICPNCYNHANHDAREELPELAQLKSKTQGERALHCILCDGTVEVDRVSCTNPGCPSNVICDGMCLTCLSSQNDPRNFSSNLEIEGAREGHRYDLNYAQGRLKQSEWKNFLDDEAAKEYGRLSMLAPHLASWEAVIIRQIPLGVGSERRLLGTWVREASGLTWKDKVEINSLNKDG